MLLARSAGRLALALNNATLGLLILVIAVEGLKKRSDSWQGRWQRVGAAFIPALLLSILDQISWIALDVHATGWFLGKFANHFEWIVVADLLADILIACTIGFSAFAVVSAASNITLSQSLRRSMQLSGRARWKLSWMAVIFSTITLILFFVDSIITGRIFPDLYAQIIADQTLATTWRAFTVLVIAGAGTVLARDEDVPESWATQFD